MKLIMLMSLSGSAYCYARGDEVPIDADCPFTGVEVQRLLWAEIVEFVGDVEELTAWIAAGTSTENRDDATPTPDPATDGPESATQPLAAETVAKRRKH